MTDPSGGEAVFLWRSLATDNPTYLPDLAGGLNNLGNALSDLGRAAEALSTWTESVALFKDLARDHPDLYGSTYRRRSAWLRKAYSEHGLNDEALLFHLADHEQDMIKDVR